VSPGIDVGELPVPGTAGSLLIFGGTFDPPHTGHVELPPRARDELGLDWLVYVPAKRSPFKRESPGTTDADRLTMLGACLAGLDRVSISTLELGRSGEEPSYTVDTLREIRSRLGEGVTLRLLIGEDQARQFHDWREAGSIIGLAEPVVMRRDNEDPVAFAEAMRSHWSEAEVKAWLSRVVSVPMIPAAATEIRRLLEREGPGSPSLAGLVPEPVLEVIRERGLYAS